MEIKSKLFSISLFAIVTSITYFFLRFFTYPQEAGFSITVFRFYHATVNMIMVLFLFGLFLLPITSILPKFITHRYTEKRFRFQVKRKELLSPILMLLAVVMMYITTNDDRHLQLIEVSGIIGEKHSYFLMYEHHSNSAETLLYKCNTLGFMCSSVYERPVSSMNDARLQSDPVQGQLYVVVYGREAYTDRIE